MTTWLTPAPPLLFQDSEEEIEAKLEARQRAEEASEPEEELETPYRVLLHNDPVTPMELVTQIIHQVFGIGLLRSFWIMLTAHTKGIALVVVEPRERAERHVAEAHREAQLGGFDCLTFSAEPAEG